MIIFLLTLTFIGVSLTLLILLSQKKELKGGSCGDKCNCKNK
jgi:hypothetical protein